MDFFKNMLGGKNREQAPELMEQADQQARAGNLDEALRTVDKAIRADGSLSEAWTVKANVLAAMGRDQEMAECFRKLTELNPTQAKAFFEFGLALSRLGRTRDEEAAYRRCLELDPDFADAHLELGRVFDESGRKEEALESYDRALKLNEQEPIAWMNRGNTLKDLERFDEALESYDRCLALDPADALTWHNKASCLARMKKWDEAVKTYTRSLELDETFCHAWSGRATCYEALEQFPRAAADLEKSLALNPLQATTLSNLGVCYQLLGKVNEAGVLFCRAMGQACSDEERAQAYFGAATAYQMLGRLGEAGYCARRFCRHAPEDDPRRDKATAIIKESGQYEPRFEEGDRLGREGRTDSAAALWSQLSGGIALYELARCLDKSKQPEAAVEKLTQALAHEPNLVIAYVLKGDLLLELDRDQEAAECYRQGLEVDPFEPDLLVGLGRALGSQPEEALRYFTRAVEVDPGNAMSLWGKLEHEKNLGRAEEAQATLKQILALARLGEPTANRLLQALAN